MEGDVYDRNKIFYHEKPRSAQEMYVCECERHIAAIGVYNIHEKASLKKLETSQAVIA